MKGFIKGTAAVVLGGLILLVVVIVLIAAAVSSGVDGVEAERDRHGITAKQFRSIKQGTTRRTIERRFGEPENAQEFEQQIPELQDQPARSSCIYYVEKDKPLFEGRSFQFCFDGRRLTSKNQY